ncbi:glycerophosphodiester phosphodiesterase [Terrisporobacter mayombei]|uniref:Glycerophosphodiester phosphodiesterase n=1 Tax=Terrisporobacter mayombei TaxID=1541 RepID=A0ABY9Q6L3_9FIRM|nr:glycerophosphodiester phosphodiesterase [Terrisporobacter mayombei]MCC3868982.1 glycerophosphodiester phosphodiesterase [Terrisporobacter mayombei]WMT82884.1 Glycerophosphodiester phosphodiesterase [Terrisporobacter mayombei]
MKVFAHRGASGDYPENTMLAFSKALSIGVDGIELDVHKSKDGQLVVIHDEDVQRTFKGKGLIKDYTLDEIKSFMCRKFEFIENEDCKIPTLKEVFELIKNENIILNIEAKTDLIHYDLEQDLLNLIKEYCVEDKIFISAFNHKCLNILQNLDNRFKYGALYEYEKDYAPEANVVEHAKKLNVYSINISKQLVSKEIVDLAHKNNMKVFVYTINKPNAMRKMIKFNVDGVFSDYPDLMNEILKEYD